MTVYVDDMEADYEPKHRPGAKYVMCHMVADTEEELHAMADRVGVSRRWHQGDHYDIVKTKRKLAVENGAVEITWLQCSAMMCIRERQGGPLADPKTAVAAYRMLRKRNVTSR